MQTGNGLSIEDYETICKQFNFKSQIDKPKEEKIKICINNIILRKSIVENSEINILNDIINNIKNINIDDKMLEITKLGYTAIALAYLGFEETDEEYIKLQVQDTLKSELTVFEIKNNYLLAVFDQTQFPTKKSIEQVFYKNKIKTFTELVYVHPKFK